MPIRRKKTTIVEEIDDSSQTVGPTVAPTAFITDGGVFVGKEIETGKAIADAQDAEPSNQATPAFSTGNTGKTYADVISDFANDPRYVAAFLMFAPFPFFASRIDEPVALITPLIVGIILNAIWFGVDYLRKQK